MSRDEVSAGTTASSSGVPGESHPHHVEDACHGQWCCGCRFHPPGKPWGWAMEQWERHYEEAHRG